MKLNFTIKTKEEVTNYVKFPDEIDFAEVDLFGQEGYDASNLIQGGVKIPPTFIVTSAAFDQFLTFNNIVTSMAKLLKEVKPFDRETAEHVSHEIKKIFETAVFPDDIKNEIQEKYSHLSESTDTPLIILTPSHIIKDEYLSDRDKNHKEIVISGIEDILLNIKDIWANLFSAQSLEIRANKYYQGPISTGILIQKKIKNEISIKAYNQSSDLGDKRFIDIKCIYGLKYNDAFFEESCDIYRINKADDMLINLFVNEQRTMYIFDRHAHGGSYIKQANVSPAWMNIKKLDDNKIEDVLKIVKKLEEIYKNSLEISIALESGQLFVESITVHDVALEEDNIGVVKAAPVMESPIKKVLAQEQPAPQPEMKMTKSRITELANEIIQDTKQAIIETVNDIKNFEPSLNFQKVQEQSPISSGKSVETEIDSTKMIFLNVSNFKSEYLSSSRNFDGGFVNGTDLVLNHNRLPEELLSSPSDLRKLIGDFSVDMSTAAKSLSNKPLIYQFSSIGSFERKLLNVVEMKYKYDHDERFLEIPESLAIETIAIKRSRVEQGNKNIWISIPFTRNKKNLQDILKIIHLQGLQRSKSFKVFLEIVSPMTFFAFEENDFANFDGVIFNLDKIAKIGNYKSTLRETDLAGAIELVERFIKKYKVDDYIINLNVPDAVKVIKKIELLKFTGLILNQLPDRNLIEMISDL